MTNQLERLLGMKNGLLMELSALALICGWSVQAPADYPIVSHRYLADPSSLVTEERIYVCGG